MTALLMRPRIGRPPLHRSTVSFNPALEQRALEGLARQAGAAQLALSTYLEQLVAAAHGYTGAHLQSLHVLPAVVSAHTLRERTDALTPEDVIPYALPGRTKSFRVDEDLAVIVKTRAAGLDITYADYLRCIFREATGLTVPRAYQQHALLYAPPRATARAQDEGVRTP